MTTNKIWVVLIVGKINPGTYTDNQRMNMKSHLSSALDILFQFCLLELPLQLHMGLLCLHKLLNSQEGCRLTHVHLSPRLPQSSVVRILLDFRGGGSGRRRCGSFCYHYRGWSSWSLCFFSKPYEIWGQKVSQSYIIAGTV